MAYIGSIYLGGIENSIENAFNSGVGFFLYSESKFNHIYYFEDGTWEIEVHEGQKTVVARCKHILTIDQILSTGLELCQQALDLMSVSGMDSLQVKNPGDNHILLFVNNDKIILREVSINDLTISFKAEATLLDRNGNIIPRAVKPQPKWINAFRYFRLSQLNTDLFDSYRNLYLSFESLLNDICPKEHREYERIWLRRALKEINKKVDLSAVISSTGQNPVDNIIKNDYINVRCKLFHAKGNSAILPYKNINPTLIAESHRRITRLWNEIATNYTDIQLKRSGGMSLFGFNRAMEALNNDISFYATSDPTPINEDDTEVSPLGLPFIKFSDIHYDKEYSPGIVLLSGGVKSEELHGYSPFHRFCVLLEGNLALMSFIDDGLCTAGIDRLESYMYIRNRFISEHL